MTNEQKNITPEDLGYDEFFDQKRTSLGEEALSVGRVIAEHKEAYTVKNQNGEFLAKVTGKRIFDATGRADFPAVGDWVAMTELDQEKAVIHHILPRKTMLAKRYSDKQDMQIIATNIDAVFIIGAADRDYNLNRIERYVVLARDGGIRPIIVVNKIDLVSEEVLAEMMERIKERFGGIDVIATCAVSGLGHDDMMRHMTKGETYCFIGSSGVGKSSLINKLLKRDVIKTQEISEAVGKGKHTTTAREMYFLENGAIVIDNPGTREVGVADAHEGIENVFDEMTALSHGCTYADCTHMHEPGCAVLQALERGELDEDKYHHYIKLKKENEFYEMTDLEKREKDRTFGKFMKKAVDQLREFEP